MNVLFLTVAEIGDLKSQNIYGDLLKTFSEHGHSVYVVSPREKKTNRPTDLETVGKIQFLHVRTGNLQKCGFLEKGISQLRLQRQFENAIDRHFGEVDFDLILYPTPPTTLAGLIKKLKTRYRAKTYLLLKDIFPQNSIDLGLLSTKGPKGVIYRYFKKTERETYEVSDYIGCMSEANLNYLLDHEPWLDKDKVEINPNSVIPRVFESVEKNAFRDMFGLPPDVKVFVYGGNLGKPQTIDFLVRVLRKNEEMGNVFFAIAGDGTDRYKLENYFKAEVPQKAKLFPYLSREDFDSLLLASDCGIVLLDARFTIPNFPSRSISYMQAGIPYIAATDDASDIGTIAEANGFGLKTDSVDETRFLSLCMNLSRERMRAMGDLALSYMGKNYTTEHSYNLIMERMHD